MLLHCAVLKLQLFRVPRACSRVFYALGHKHIPTVLHTGLLLLMHPLPGLSKCSWYKPSDIQHYQQRVMKGMSWQSAAVTRQKPPRCLQQGRKYHIKIKARQGKIAHTLGWKEIQTTPKPLVPLSSSQCSTEKICLE